MHTRLRRTLPAIIALPAAAYAYMYTRQQQAYRELLRLQQTISTDHEGHLALQPYHEATLPSFADRVATLPTVLAPATFDAARAAAEACHQSERSYIPAHKKGGTVAYEALHHKAPLLVALYRSTAMRRLCSAIIGEPLECTPVHDQSSCSLLWYDRPGDHIDWHHDYNFYNGRHFTVLIPLVNEGPDGRLSSVRLLAERAGGEAELPTAPNTLIVFEGARVRHKVTPLGTGERRLMLSMTYCTDPRDSALKRTGRRLKDTAFFGIRALWT